MNENIQKILEQVALEKGITSEEVKTLFVLGNNDLFEEFLQKIQTEVSAEEFTKIKTVFLEEKENVQNANKEYAEGVEQIITNAKADVFEEKIKKMVEMNPKDLELLIDTIEQL